MEIASLIISVIALIASLGVLVIMLAKNYFSTHQVQMVPVNDPMQSLMEGFPQTIGKSMSDPYKELGDPITDEEREHLELTKKKRQSKI